MAKGIRVLNQKYSLKELWCFKRNIFKVVFIPKRIWNIFLIWLSLLLRKSRVWGRPIVVMLEPTSRCNLRCPMCPRQLFPTKRPEQDMDIADYKKIITELSCTAMVLALWNYGEPFLHDDIFEMIAFAKSKDMGVVLSTNATILNDEKINLLLNSGLDYLIISLDGASKEIYEQYRMGAKFDVTIRNIKMLIARREELGKGAPFVNLQYLVMKENEHEIENLKQLARQLNVDRVSLKNVYYVKRKKEEFLPKNKSYICSYYYQNIIRRCSRPFISTLINANGDVLPCCSDLEFKNIFGNVFKDRAFHEIWNNDRYRKFRQDILSNKNLVSICENCAGTDFNDQTFESIYLK